MVEKRLVLREEIHLTLTPASERLEKPVIVRKQRAIVESIELNEKSQDAK